MGNIISSTDETLSSDNNLDSFYTARHLTSSSLNKKNMYCPIYNLIPSYPTYYPLINEEYVDKNFIKCDLPSYIDLRQSFPPIIDMGQLPLNPIYSILYIIQYKLVKYNLPVFPLSAIYTFNHINGFENIKSVFSFDQLFKSIQNYGISSESEVPTNHSNLNIITDTDIILERARALRFIDVYQIEQNLHVIKSCLKNGMPILVGMCMFVDLVNIDTTLWMPNNTIDHFRGGLSGVIVGYIDERQMFIVAQTFGDNFGQHGYILVPYDYILDIKLTFEIYSIDLLRSRVEGYLNQRKEMISLETKTLKNIEKDKKKDYDNDDILSTMFS